jgi:hypothetical protein
LSSVAFCPTIRKLCGVFVTGFGKWGKKPMTYKPPATAWALPSANVTYTKTKSIAQMVRDATNGGQKLIDVLVSLAFDEDAHPRDRTTAVGMLMDRGFGKAVETSLTLTADASQSDALSQIADAELERLAATLAPSTVRPVVVLPAGSLSPGVESLPDAPPEALEAPLRPSSTVTEATPSVLATPVHPLPPPLARAPRRRVVVHPPVRRDVATVDGPEDGTDKADKG